MQYHPYPDNVDKWWTEHISRPDIYTRSVICTGFYIPAQDPYGILRAPYGMEHTEESRAGYVRCLFRRRAGALFNLFDNNISDAVSSRTGPVAWCDHKNSTGVNPYVRFTRPYGQEIVRVLKIVRGPCLDVTEA